MNKGKDMHQVNRATNSNKGKDKHKVIRDRSSHTGKDYFREQIGQVEYIRP